MGLVRVGMACFGVGLFVASVAAVVFGVSFGCTEIACENPGVAFALRGVSLSGVVVYDGCNTCRLNLAVVAGAVLSTLGVVLGGIGVGAERLADE